MCDAIRKLHDLSDHDEPIVWLGPSKQGTIAKETLRLKFP